MVFQVLIGKLVADKVKDALVKGLIRNNIGGSIDDLGKSVRNLRNARVDVTVNGADQFFAASKALKAAGQTEMRKELHKEMRDGAKPLIGKSRAAARATLPARGGLAESVAKAPQRVQVRTGQKTAGVRVVVGKRRGSGAAAANKGVIRHPVFGNEDAFVEQRVTPGWFDKTLEKEAPAIRKNLERAVENTLNKIARSGK